MKKADHRHHRLLRARRERPSGRRTAELGYQLAPSEGDRHVTLPCEGCLGNISRRECAVSPFGLLAAKAARTRFSAVAGRITFKKMPARSRAGARG